jgi:uncharacterized membrane protein YfcA
VHFLTVPRGALIDDRLLLGKGRAWWSTERGCARTKNGRWMSVAISQRDRWRGRASISPGTLRPTTSATPRAHCWLAFAWALPVALLGGLIGLGGAECRLPILAGPLRHSLREAVPLNLAVSLVTLVAALAVRLPSHSLAPLHGFLPVVLAVMLGATITVLAGTNAVGRLPETHLARAIVGLLLLIGVMLISAAMLPQRMPVLIPEVVSVQIVVGLILGLAVGAASSLLGVAGGALLIPMLIFAYGLDIKAAGTASLLVSLPIVLIGIGRFARLGAYHHHALRGTVAPMGVSSVLGAVSGGLLVGRVSVPILTGSLGALIIYSAWRTFAMSQQPGRRRPGR